VTSHGPLATDGTSNDLGGRRHLENEWLRQEACARANEEMPFFTSARKPSFICVVRCIAAERRSRGEKRSRVAGVKGVSASGVVEIFYLDRHAGMPPAG